MPLLREPIYAALFDRLKVIPGLKTTSRRLRHVSEVPAQQQPALFLSQGGQRPNYETGRTTLWDLGAVIYVYAKDPKSENPGSILNPILDAIEAALAFDNPNHNACTLGGLVHWCRLGEMESDEGTMGEQAVVRIEVSMRAPSA